MVGGFPAFPDWLTGCSATVATLLQPNMWVITAALRAGNVAPPGSVPGGRRRQCVVCALRHRPAVLRNRDRGLGRQHPRRDPASSAALSVYGNVQSDLHAYQDANTTVASQQNTQVALALQVVKAQTKVATAQAHYEQVEHELGTFAVSEYIHNGLYDANALAGGGSTSESQTGLAAQQYTKVAATDMVDRVQAASAAVTSAQGDLADADRGLQRAGAALLADEAAENHALEKLIDDTATLQTAGACTTVSIIQHAVGTVELRGVDHRPAARGATTTTTTPTSTTVPSTTPRHRRPPRPAQRRRPPPRPTHRCRGGRPASGASSLLPADRAGVDDHHAPPRPRQRAPRQPRPRRPPAFEAGWVLHADSGTGQPGWVGSPAGVRVGALSTQQQHMSEARS